MFVDFFYTLRDRGIPVTPTSFLRLHQALSLGLVQSMEDFYTAARAIPPLPGASGRLPAGFVACALVLGLSLFLLLCGVLVTRVDVFTGMIVTGVAVMGSLGFLFGVKAGAVHGE